MTANCIREAGHQLPQNYVQDTVLSTRGEFGKRVVVCRFVDQQLIPPRRSQLHFERTESGTVVAITVEQFNDYLKRLLT